MKQFNVLIEDNGRFIPYDIMPYLKRSFIELLKRINEYGEGDYWKYPKTYDEIKEWVKESLQYQYGARCEYEIILSPWPSYTNENGEEIIKDDKCRKIDIYDQCMMNIDLIVRLFIEEIYTVYTRQKLLKNIYF